MGNDTTGTDQLALDMHLILTECLQNGFVLPLIAACIAVNGGVFVLRYTADEGGGLRAESLAQHNEAGAMMVLPINIMVSDARGEAARVFIGPDGKTQMMH
jgi:hypothetical protein